MSGILDKKSRVIDFVITENGRSQMQSGDIRYRFATISDKSIVYTKDHELSKTKKADITDSEKHFLPLEASASLNDEINKEFDLRNYFLNGNNDILNVENFQNSTDFDTSVNQFIAELSTGNYLKSLSYLTTSSVINKETNLKFFDSGYLNNDLDFESNINLYDTISAVNVQKRNIPVIALDKRFSHKNNFLYLPPVDLNGEDLYQKENFKNINDLEEENTSGFLFSSYNKLKDNDEVQTRDLEIIKVLRNLEKNNDILKRVYKLEDNTDINTFLFEMFEVKSIKNKIEKLNFIKIGSFYDRKSLTTKRVYLVGKIIDTRDSAEDLDVLFNFNNGNINLDNSDNNTFAISSYFSFINLFTLVVE